MTSEERQMERLHATPLLVASVVVQIVASALFLVNLTHQRLPAVPSWCMVMIATSIAALSCWQVSGTPGVDRVTRRLWRQMAVVCALVVLGTAGDARQSVVNPAKMDREQHDPITAALYALAMLTLLWALLRLPIGKQGQKERMFRFVLDALTVTITVGIFALYFVLRLTGSLADIWSATVPMVILASVGLIGALAFIKVAISGLGGMDRLTIRLLAVAAVVGAGGGGLFPLLVTMHTGLNGSQFFVPATMVFVAFAADRQRRSIGMPVIEQRGRYTNLLPYLAVAATDGLLLLVSRRASGLVMTIAVAAVSLTALVVIRQVRALWENDRLLRRNNAQLEQLGQYQDELTHRATHDDLTDLPNRALFEQATIDGLARRDNALSVALIDLDDFKAINDRLGHAVGDALLVVVAHRLRDCVRTDDVVSRLGGDEFGLLLHGLHSEEATDVLARITEALSLPVHALGHDLLVQASVGLAEAWPDASPQELLRRADLAMYAAKERGKGRHAVYDSELEQHQAADAQLGAELRQALDSGAFTLVYQPIVRLPDGAWTGMEALVRWQRPGPGFVGPDTFIPIAERTGLIVPLGSWILREALRQAVEWDVTYGPAAPREIGVNVSARQLREPGFADDVRDALATSGFDPERLVVEVTETAVFDGGVAVDTLRTLVGLGVKVALDDFGTGHSSLGLLRTCPADTLKVDKSFVDGIGLASEEAVIATAMIQITNGLHLQAIAEGVETVEQADTLYRLGYRFAQGYYFSRPLSPAQVRTQLDAVASLTV